MRTEIGDMKPFIVRDLLEQGDVGEKVIQGLVGARNDVGQD